MEAPHIRADMEREAEGLRKLWRCPIAVDGVEHEPYRTADELPYERTFQPHECLSRARACVGDDLPLTCPTAAARHPDAHAVVMARQYRDHGQLAEVAPSPTPAVLVDAMAELDRAVHECEREHRRRIDTREAPFDRKD